MEFCLLGPLVVRCGPMVLVPPGKQRAVLAALLLNAGRVVSMDELAEILWGHSPPPSARVTAQNYVMRLRKTLGHAAGSRVSTQSPGYRIRIDASELDVSRFEAHLDAARAAARARAWDAAAAEARAGLALWRGEPLADVDSEVLAAREVPRLGELRLQAVETRIDADLHLGRHGEVIAELRQLASAEPLRERLHGLLMLALYRDGRQGEALAAYQQARRVLVDELGAEPGPLLRELHQRVLAADPELAVPQQPQSGSPGRAVAFSLPPDTAEFTGRGQELGQITAAVASAARAGGVVAVRAIGGMPGAGKTALAVHVAHLLRAEFPDRQLFLDLHAHTPGREPVRPEDALAGLLAAAGVDPRFVPAGLDERAGMWRDRMAGQRAILVLDNAAGSGQVAPLLPGSAGCLVLVTSRRHLGDLPGAVTPVLLDVLPPSEAQEMFSRLAPRAAADREGVAEVVELAGFLPLAISLLARLFARHPSWTLADLAGETRAGLLTLTAENDSVAAAFDLSYRHLGPARQRLFCLLGLHPGATTDVYAAAALAGGSLGEAAGLLDGLHAEGLLTEAGHRRYGMHDLIRRYARDRAPASLGGQGEQALSRLLDYYQHAAAVAGARLARQVRPGPAPVAPAGLPAVPALGDAGQALAWARADRASLIACLDHVTRAGQHARVIALTAGLAGLWRHDGPWADAIPLHAAAVQAAQTIGDRLAQANAVADLAEVRWLTGDYFGAAQAQDQALSLYRDLGDRLGQANALTRLGSLRRETGDYPGAAQAQHQALSLYRDLGDRLGQANALNYLGSLRRLTGDYSGAAQALEQALSISRDLGYRGGEAEVLNETGTLYRVSGNLARAAQCHHQALDLARAIATPWDQAQALAGLGRCALAAGHPAQAQDLLWQAHQIFQQAGLAEASTVLAELSALTGPPPAR